MEMNSNLDKLIEQYERETGESCKYVMTDLMYNKHTPWNTDFIRWLASRPTCGKEQRKFLDEIESEKFQKYDGTLGFVIFIEDRMPEIETSIYQKDFTADLEKVIEGK